MTKTIEQRKEEIFKRIPELYARKINNPIGRITKKMEGEYLKLEAAGNVKAQEEFLDLAQDIFDERENVVRHRKNVLRQMAEIAKVDNNPQEIDISQWQSQLSSGAKNLVNYGDIEAIKEYDQPIIHVRALPRNSLLQNEVKPLASKIVTSFGKSEETYRRKVEHASGETQDAVDMNLSRLEKFLEEGHDLSDDDKKKILSKTSQFRSTRGLAIDSMAAMRSVTQELGKGIISESKAIDGSYNKAYSSRKEQFLSDLLQKIRVDQSGYGAAMQRYLSRISSQSFDPLDSIATNQIQALLEEEIKQDKETAEERFKQLNEALERQHKAMLDDMQTHEDKSDELWKYRAAMIFLAFTPLGAFSIAGHVFNYLDPLINIFGPVFDGNLSFSEGLSKVMTSEQFGFMGEAADALGIDDATQFLLDNTPLVNQACDLIDVLMDNEITQGLFAEVAPLLGSPLVLIGISAAFSLSRAPEELKHNKGKDDSIKKHDKALKDAFDNFEKDLKDGFKSKDKDGAELKGSDGKPITKKGADSRIQEFVKKEHELLKKSNFELKAIEFLADNIANPIKRGVLREIFKDLKFNYGEGNKDLFEIFDAGKFSDEGKVGNPVSLEEMIKFMTDGKASDDQKKNPAVYKAIKEGADKFREKLSERFTLIAGIDEGLARTGKASANLADILPQYHQLTSPRASTETSKEAEKLSKNSKEIIHGDFIRLRADSFSIANAQSSEIPYLEARLRERDVDALKKSLEDTPTPSPNIVAKSAAELGGRSVFMPPKDPSSPMPPHGLSAREPRGSSASSYRIP
jgi:hypothetical protein